MNMKKAFVMDVTSQDGSYLSEPSFSNDYDVHGILKQESTFTPNRYDLICVDLTEPLSNFFLNLSYLSGLKQISNIIYNAKLEKVWHLGAQNHYTISPSNLEYSGNATTLRTVRILESIRRTTNHIKFYQSSSSEARVS
jgi:GDPmannose 4,6-dehydratase